MALCRRCGGQKKVLGIGFVECNCPECKGSGEHIYIRQDEPTKASHEAKETTLEFVPPSQSKYAKKVSK